MKLFYHFFKSNIIYNKVELAISFGIATILCLAVARWQLFEKEFLLMCVSYGTMYAYMSNKKKTSLKYLISLPVSKSKLILAKAAADGIYFFPVALLLLVSNHLFKAGFGDFALMVLLFQVCMTLGIVLLEQEVEEPRVENGKGSFLNRLIYVRKILDLFLILGLGGTFLFIVYSIEIPMAIKQYFMILIMSFVIFFKYRKCMKLMLDESLSYFMFKRDLVKTSLKLGLPVALIVLSGFALPDFKTPYGENGVYSFIKEGDVAKARQYVEKNGPEKVASERGQFNFSPGHAAILSGNVGMLEYLLTSLGEEKALEGKLQGGFAQFGLAHMAVKSGEVKVLDYSLSKLKLDINEFTQKTKETPLHLASKNCRAEMVDYLLEKGAKVNIQDAKGNTPLMAAVGSRCVGAVVMLLHSGADPTLKNKKGKTALEGLKKVPSLEYYAQRFSKKEQGASRGLASKSSSESISRP